MYKQQGAALVIVMALISSGLMVGVSGMNASLVDERLAGNYRAIAEAQMGAESAASESLSSDNETDFWESDSGEYCYDIINYDYDERTDLDWYNFFEKTNDNDNENENENKYEVLGKSIRCENDGRVVALSWGIVALSWVDFLSSGNLESEFFLMYNLDQEEPPIESSGKGLFLSNGKIEIKGNTKNFGNLSTDDEVVPRIHSNASDPDIHNSLKDNSEIKITSKEEMTLNVPDPSSSGSGYVDAIFSGKENFSHLGSCDLSDILNSSENIILCNGDINGNLKKDDDLGDKIIVVAGSIDINPHSKSEIDNTSFIVSESVNFKGMGGSGIAGLIWAGGEVDIKGNSVFTGSIISQGSIKLNGGPDLFFDPSFYSKLDAFSEVISNPFKSSKSDTTSSGEVDPEIDWNIPLCSPTCASSDLS